ncbi:MAG: ATP-binding protein, partial [Rickettsiales bacterium]
QMVIQVKDTGIGIAPKDISKVMMPFGQVDNKLSRKYEGTGLGLPLSRKFVELMGGEFTIESELNVGTSVTVRLPKAPKNWKPPEEESASHVEASDEPETT